MRLCVSRVSQERRSIVKGPWCRLEGGE
jgi:hypothetical protein